MRLRNNNKRAPGHCWQDNELYEVFLPVVGAQAAFVFCAMTRWCYGHEVRMGLRELAEEAGVSRNTAHRATVSMEALGMIRIVAGRGSAPAHYDLLDLKEASIALGATWSQQRCSHVLDEDQVRALRARLGTRVPGLAILPPRRPASGSGPVAPPHSRGRDGDPGAGDPEVCVPVRDTNHCGKACGSDGFVSQNEGVCVPVGDASVPKPGSPSITQYTIQQEKLTPPLPLPAMREGERDSELRSEIDRLMRECSFAGQRLERLLGEVLQQFAERERMGFNEAADAMVAAWREYQEGKPWLRYAWGPKKFFADGNWLNSDGWPWDRERIEQRNRARVGA